MRDAEDRRQAYGDAIEAAVGGLRLDPEHCPSWTSRGWFGRAAAQAAGTGERSR
jgi:hypothetical protein